MSFHIALVAAVAVQAVQDTTRSVPTGLQPDDDGSALKATTESHHGAMASHIFSPYTAEVLWSPPGVHSRKSPPSLLQYSLLETDSLPEEKPVRILHVTDNHISLDDTDPPHTTRMYSAFLQTSDFLSKNRTSPKDEFTSLLQKAKRENVDLIALGGDLINFPSQKTVSWALEQLRTEAPDIPFIYTAGNHDWLEEGHELGNQYDSARSSQLDTTLRPLFEKSVARADPAAGPGAGRLYGKTSVRGVDVYFVDNSNHQVNKEQLDYMKGQLERDGSKPAVLLMHMPLKLPSTPSTLQPKYLCGHPSWGADSDENSLLEMRPRWPKEGNSPSTTAFIKLVEKHSAPAGRLAALLTGHVHKDFTAKLEDANFPNAANLTALSCGKEQLGCKMHATTESGSTLMQTGAQHMPRFDAGQAMGALQYTTLDAAEGGYRLLTVRTARPLVY